MDRVSLLLGVMTDPRLTAWREHYRHKMQEQQVAGADITTRFVMGSVRTCTEESVSPAEDFGPRRCRTDHPLSCQKLAREQSEFGDLVVLMGAGECGSRSGVAVAQKSFEFYAWAAAHSTATFIGKLDDDALPNLRLLWHDLRQIRSHGARNGSTLHAYHGAMRWRAWSYTHRHSCVAAQPKGYTSDRSEGFEAYRATNRVLTTRRRFMTVACTRDAVGPFPCAPLGRRPCLNH